MPDHSIDNITCSYRDLLQIHMHTIKQSNEPHLLDDDGAVVMVVVHWRAGERLLVARRVLPHRE